MTDPRPGLWTRWRHLTGLIFIGAVAVVMLVAIAIEAIPPPGPSGPIVCAECDDPYRPESTSCDQDLWNPTTLPGGANNLACNL